MQSSGKVDVSSSVDIRHFPDLGPYSLRSTDFRIRYLQLTDTTFGDALTKKRVVDS